AADRGTPAARPPWSQTARLLGAMSLGSAGLIAGVAVAGTGLQRGLSDARDTADIGGWTILCAAVAVVLVVVGWLAQPRVDPAPVVAAPATAVALAPGERAA